uniref:Cell cycle checkpoint protein RAD1-like n=1 Tax=Sinocyclocheilus anshuiensis TaxID=1608454 RepID=A0A671LF89_9TELE
MPLSTQSQADIDQYILIASLDNARNLSNILKAISFRDHAIFNATQNGLKVTVEDSKCLQANAFIQVDIFQEYIIKEDAVGFQVNLTMSLLKPSTKALALSCKVSVRTDSRGFLSLQYLVRNDDGQICFVEYYCCPDEVEEE